MIHSGESFSTGEAEDWRTSVYSVDWDTPVFNLMGCFGVRRAESWLTNEKIIVWGMSAV